MINSRKLLIFLLITPFLMKRYYITILLSTFSILLLLMPLSYLYAQQDQDQEIKPMRASTKSFYVELLLSSTPEPNKEVNMHITFFQKANNTQLRHVDYVITVKDSNSNIIDRIPPEPAPILHTDSGNITVPYTFKTEGNYTISVDIKGILFQAVPTETAEFNVTVVPEFPPMLVLVTFATLIALYITLVRYKGYNPLSTSR